ncbi:MAG: alkaline phosphatase family protein [Methanothrix sp.]|nr:alkaline phosphatase family protein [Methanothrix sp.]
MITKDISSPPSFSQLDIAPTIASILGLNLPQSDGKTIRAVAEWDCKKAALIIVDSLGYDLLRHLLPDTANMSLLCKDGLLFPARAVSNRTTPAIASILSGLLPEHHQILDKAGAKESSILSLPEIASAAGEVCAVIMEQNGAEVYQGLIEMVHGIPDSLPPEQFDIEACRLTCQALHERPDLLVSYFIGIDKNAHLGSDLNAIKKAALLIDRCIGRIMRLADEETLLVICGDHPIHAGELKREREPYCVAMIFSRGRAGV